MPQSFALRGSRALIVPLAILFGLVPTSAAVAAGTNPVIKKVSPLKIEVGQTLTITGKGFLKGKNRNIVVFKRDGKQAIFAKADNASTTRITLKVPTKVLPFLTGNDGKATPKTFRLRVLAKRFGKAFTAKKMSPSVGPPGAFGGTGDPSGSSDCDNDKILNKNDADDDNDLLPDTAEKTYKTDPCKLDTDGDGVSDTFEIESALDLNLRALPYPGKRPYPNALDGGDGGYDFDQDGLTMQEEYAIWQYTGGKLPLTYSDGDQDTNVDSSDTPVNPGNALLDMNANGVLTDDEKDVDGDGISNWDETSGRLKISWWAAVYQSEKQYVGGNGASPLTETSVIDPDSDGDGIVDGQDDQDHDGWTNYDELSRARDFGGGTRYWVHVYNPCLPDYLSRACSLHPPVSDPWAPFPLPSPTPPSPLTLTVAP